MSFDLKRLTPVRALRGVGKRLIRAAENLERKRSRIVKNGTDRTLYRTFYDSLFWLNDFGHVDRCIIETGIFEPASTRIVNRFIKKGDIVLDVGANIGYYTVLLAGLVGEEGRVIAFEPTSHFGEVLNSNIEANQLTNVQVCNYGLSSSDCFLDIDIGMSSATIHSSNYYDPIIKHEKIELKTLESAGSTIDLSRIDFIKIDVDGHEPHFFNGAWKILEKIDPLILFEVSHLHYMKAGFDVCDFYKMLKEKGYRVYYEHDLEEIKELDIFLIKCGNFERTANVIACKGSLGER